MGDANLVAAAVHYADVLGIRLKCSCGVGEHYTFNDLPFCRWHQFALE
jgi:hypothetical protein